MFRSSKTILQCISVSRGIESAPLRNPMCFQFVRGVRPRKPAFSGIAKTKLFIVYPRPLDHLPEQDRVELRRLDRNYKLRLNSIMNYFREENARHEAGSQEAEEEIAAKEKDWQESLLKIKEWNASIVASREERRAKEREQREANAKSAIQAQEEEKKKLIAEAEAKLKREKEMSAAYITEENIDVAIEKALNDIQDFNYAIDFKGKKYIGRFTKLSESSGDISSDKHTPESSEPAAPISRATPKDLQL